MPTATIRFRHNPRTGQRELVIDYESDADSLPFEHEREHRTLVERLVGQPASALAASGVLERETVQTEAERPEEAVKTRTPEAQGQ